MSILTIIEHSFVNETSLNSKNDGTALLNAILWNFKSVEHFLVLCPNFSLTGTQYLNNVCDIIPPYDLVNVPVLSHVLLYGNDKYTFLTNILVLNETQMFIAATKRLDPLEAYDQ